MTVAASRAPVTTNLHPRLVLGTDAHQGVHAVLDELAVLVDDLDVPLAPIPMRGSAVVIFEEAALRP